MINGVTEHTSENGKRHVFTAQGIPPKNITGNLGPRCEYCSGLGFTNSITGGSHSCKRCDATGIEPQKANKDHIQQQIDDLREIVLDLVQVVKGNK